MGFILFMKKILKLSTLLVLLAAANLCKAKTPQEENTKVEKTTATENEKQEQAAPLYTVLKEKWAYQMDPIKAEYPKEYKVAAEALGYSNEGIGIGLTVGFLKGCIPFVAKRGSGPFKCAALGILVGPAVAVPLYLNADWLISTKNRCKQVFYSEEEQDKIKSTIVEAALKQDPSVITATVTQKTPAKSAPEKGQNNIKTKMVDGASPKQDPSVVVAQESKSKEPMSSEDRFLFRSAIALAVAAIV